MWRTGRLVRRRAAPRPGNGGRAPPSRLAGYARVLYSPPRRSAIVDGIQLIPETLIPRLLAAVWLLVLVRILWPGGVEAVWVEAPAAAALALLYSLCFPLLRWQTRILVLPLGVGAALIAVALDDWGPVWRGFVDGTTLAAFFVTLVILRTTAERRPETNRARRRMETLEPRQRIGATLFGANIMGAVLIVGAHAVLAPVHDPNAPEAQRERIAAIALRGMGLAGFWSPFWVAMALCFQYLPDVPLWSVMMLGFGLAAAALFLAHVMTGARPGDTGAALRALQPVMPPVALATAVVVALASFTALRPIEALLLGIPALAVAAQIRPGPRFLKYTLKQIVRRSYERTVSVFDETAVVAYAMMFGSTLASGLDALDPVLLSDGEALPAAAVIAVVIVLPAALALVGIHQIATIAALLALFIEIPTDVADLILFQAALISWSLSSMIGLSAISTVTAASFFKVRVRRLAYGPSLSYCATVAALGIVVLTLLNAVLA